MITEQKLLQIVVEAMNTFNAAIPGLPRLEWDKWYQENKERVKDFKEYPVMEKIKGFYPFSRDNTIIAFTTGSEYKKVYQEICKQYFPRKIEGVDLDERDYMGTGAEALVGKYKNGIILRTDTPYSAEEYRHVILHELAHIFCLRTEMGDEEHFIDIYLGTTTDELVREDKTLDGCIVAGHEVWREFIAEYLATTITGVAAYSIKEKAALIKKLIVGYKKNANDPKVAKEITSQILYEIMTSEEVMELQNEEIDIDAAWDEIRSKLQALNLFPVPKNTGLMFLYNMYTRGFYRMVELVFKQIMGNPQDRFEWNISKDYIVELGIEYINFVPFSLAGN